MNGYLRSAAEAKGMRVIDLGPSLAPSGLLSPAYTTDGVHFSASAYVVWRSEIEKAWTDLLRAYPEKVPAPESCPGTDGGISALSSLETFCRDSRRTCSLFGSRKRYFRSAFSKLLKMPM